MKNRRQLAIISCIGVLTIFTSFIAGVTGSFVGNYIIQQDPGLLNNPTQVAQARVTLDEESAVIDVVDKSIDSVVSIIVSKDAPRLERYFLDGDTEGGVRQIGAGSGFVISADGLILTNKHVVSDEDAAYTVVLNNGVTLEAEVLARDYFLDIAVLKVAPEDDVLVPIPLGDSGSLKVGQNVIAIGNALGEFSNSVSTGIVSGLGRSIIASDSFGKNQEEISNVIQTDASINHGNSGGPLLDLLGNVVGVNVAVAESAENIGFAIPINDVKKIIESIQQYGEIRRPYIGVRYLQVSELIQEEENLPVGYGALIVEGDAGEDGVVTDSPADKAGLQVGDLIIKINGVELNEDSPLQQEVQKYNVGDEVELEYIRDGETITVTVTLEKAE